MCVLSTEQTSPLATYASKSLLEEVRHVPRSSHGAFETELLIDIDREIESMVRLSGVALEASCQARDVKAFITRMAILCAHAADRGGGRVEMLKAMAVATCRLERPWRHLASLLAQRCAMLASHYGEEGQEGPSGEVIRWLFADASPANIDSLQ